MSRGGALITGGAGQLGSDLRAALDTVVALGHEELDITEVAAVHAALAEHEPRVVFNCATYHNVDDCEANEDEAMRVNFRAVKRLAQACAASGAKLVHLSTNYVFDGTAREPYGEDDCPNPRSAYAISKLAGEHAALSYGDGTIVVRSSGLYGLAGSATKGGSFVQRMAARARSGEPIRMVADQRLTPTFTADLAAAVIEAADADLEGVLHLTNGGACSWYEFTVAILAAIGVDAEVAAVKTVRAPEGADRPLNGVLARPRADALGLGALRPWQDALADYVRQAGL